MSFAGAVEFWPDLQILVRLEFEIKLETLLLPSAAAAATTATAPTAPAPPALLF